MKYLVALLAVLALVACGDDTTTINGGGGGGSGSDGGNGGGMTEPLPTTGNSTSCNQLVRSANVGLACDSNAACGQGARCVTGQDGASACRQICFPEQECATCSATEECVNLLGSDGQALRFDLDSDGSAETVAGACLSREVVGNQGLFDECGLDQGACADGLACLQLSGRPTGTCFQECDGACNPFSGVTPICSGSTTDSDVCLISCNAEPCPGGLECVEVAMGNMACMR